MKKMIKHWYVLSIALFTFGLASCDSDNSNEPGFPDKPSSSFGYVLNQGSYGKNNSTISFYNTANNTSSDGYYQQVNGESFGDTGQDMIVYGSKIYITIYKSNQIVVTDKWLNKLKVFKMTKDEGPRYLAPANGKVYVSMYDGHVSVIDTAAMSIEVNKYTVGMNPEGITYANGRLYVANSGGMNWQNGYNDTMSIIDLNTDKVEEIKVGVNPRMVYTLADGRILISRSGNYKDDKGALAVYNPNEKDEAKRLIQIPSSINGLVALVDANTAYYVTMKFDFNTNKNISTYYKVNLKDLTLTEDKFIKDPSKISNFADFVIDRNTGLIYICDATDYKTSGKVHVYDAAGQYLKSFVAGVHPSKIVFF